MSWRMRTWVTLRSDFSVGGIIELSIFNKTPFLNSGEKALDCIDMKCFSSAEFRSD